MTKRKGKKTMKKTHKAGRRRKSIRSRREGRRRRTRGGNNDMWVDREELVELLERAKDELNKETNPNSTYQKANTVKMFEELIQEYDDNHPSAPVMK